MAGIASGGKPAVLRQTASVEVTHAFARDLTGTAIGTFTRADYQGLNIVENAISGTVRLDYRLNRTFGMRASFTHERLKSSLLGRDYTANVVLVGVRLQR